MYAVLRWTHAKSLRTVSKDPAMHDDKNGCQDDIPYEAACIWVQ